MGTENVLWDLHQFLVFFIEETVLDAVEKYIDFLEEWESDDSHLAIDWFSYLRMRHPNLCQGRQCEIRLIPKINAPPITRVLEDGSRDTRFPPFFQCYTLTRPLFLLLRRTETLDSTGSSDWGAWHRERLKWDGWNSWFNEHWPRTPEAIRPQCIQFILLATRLRYRMDVYVQWRRGQGVYSRPPTYVPPDDQSPSPARLIVEEWHRLQATCTYEEEGEEGN
ncbi:hypothetical protein DL96DRAFT_1620842 [Flagelloscypha sp. PMI_526]|nr:hypothetical protein DL96DRAFT_1620842 [Flagelloscypha sp. PMI_526]